MLKRRWTYGACFAGVLLMGMSAAPRYLEELRIGGGYGDSGGGLDIEANGDLFSDGNVVIEGDLTARGRLTAGAPGQVITTQEGFLDGGKLLDDSVTDAKVSDALTVGSSGRVDGGAIDIPAAQNETVADDADTLLVHDASAGSTREMSRHDFLSGVGGLWTDAGTYIQPTNATGVHIEDDGDVVLPGALEVRGARVSVGTASGDTYLMKAKLEGSDTLVLSERSALEGHIVWSGSSHSMSNIHGIVGRASVGSGYTAASTEISGVRGLALAGPIFSRMDRGIGVKGQVVLTQPGAVTDAMALYGGTVGSASDVTSLYGLYLEDVTQGTAANYAVYTGLGACRFGDDVTVVGDLAIQGGSITSPGDLEVSADEGAGAVRVSGSLSTPEVATFAADDTTPSVAGANIFRVPATWTAGNDVTRLDDGVSGQTVIIIGGDADCVFTDNASLHLAGGWTAHPGDTLVLVYADGVWHELSRSDN